MHRIPRARLLVAVVLLGSAPALAGEPQSYVDRNGWLGARLEQKPLKEGGIRITEVVSGGPAHKAGLRNRDVILSIRGEAIDRFETLVRLIVSTEPGTGVPVVVRRGEKTLTFTVTIGHRRMALGPMIEGGRKRFPGNSEIHPAWRGHRDPLRDLLIDLLEARGRSTLYTDLVSAFKRDEDLYQVFYKLDEVSYVRRAPLKLPLAARFLTDRIHEHAQRSFHGLASILQQAASALDESVSLPTRGPEAPASPREVLESLAFAKGLADRAFDKLSGGEREFLHHQSKRLFDKFKEHIYLNVRSSAVLYRDNLEAIRLSKKIDYGTLFLASAAAAQTVETILNVPPETWKTADLPGRRAGGDSSFTGDVLGVFDTDAGTVVIGGPGRTVYAADAALIVDLGGDDLYVNHAGASTGQDRVSIVFDAEGNDTYRSGSVCQGTGRTGVGFLVDMEGDDVYEAKDYAQGCGLFGVGLLYDHAGEDRYGAGEYHAGAGLFGIGILFDRRGDDRYAANLYSQGFGATKGFGLLLDKTGNDTYYASGKYPSSYGTHGVFRGMSQGFGIGFRQIASGGIGVLLDGFGNDHYVAGNFSQGGGYFLGYGILRDREGQDRYTGSRYCQGFGVHSAAGILMDDRGADRYRCEIAANQGSAWDLGVGWLVDGGPESDHYEAHGLAQGGASQNGFAVLLDLGGKDDYTARGGGQGFGGQTTYGGGRGAKNLGVLVDAGGEKDRYSKEHRKNGQLEVDEKGGVFADLEGTLEEVLRKGSEGPSSGEDGDEKGEEEGF